MSYPSRAYHSSTLAHKSHSDRDKTELYPTQSPVFPTNHINSCDSGKNQIFADHNLYFKKDKQRHCYGNQGLEKIKNLKGTVDEIITAKKVEITQTHQQLKSLKKYQEGVLGSLNNLNRTQYKTKYYNETKNPQDHLSSTNIKKVKKIKNFKQEIENSNLLGRKLNAKNAEDQKLKNNLSSRNQKYSQRVLQSFKINSQKPYHHRRQSSEFQTDVKTLHKSDIQLVKQQNRRLRLQLNKAQSYIKLLQRQIRQLNEHITTLEEYDDNQKDTNLIGNLEAQIQQLTKKLKALENKKIRQYQTSQIVELRLKLRAAKQQNQQLSTNLMKLLNSKLETVNLSPNKNPRVGPEQIKELYQQINHYKNKLKYFQTAVVKPAKSFQKNKAESGSSNMSSKSKTPFLDTHGGCQDNYSSSRKIKTEAAIMHQMASLLEEPKVNQFNYGLLQETKYLFQ